MGLIICDLICSYTGDHEGLCLKNSFNGRIIPFYGSATLRLAITEHGYTLDLFVGLHEEAKEYPSYAWN